MKPNQFASYTNVHNPGPHDSFEGFYSLPGDKINWFDMISWDGIYQLVSDKDLDPFPVVIDALIEETRNSMWLDKTCVLCFTEFNREENTILVSINGAPSVKLVITHKFIVRVGGRICKVGRVEKW